MKTLWLILRTQVTHNINEMIVIFLLNVLYLSVGFLVGWSPNFFSILLFLDFIAVMLFNQNTFSLKYYTSLPISKPMLVFVLSIGQLASFIPLLIVFALGYSYFPKHQAFNSSFAMTFAMTIMGAIIFNLFTLKSVIERPRIEFAKGRMIYLVNFFKHIVNYILVLALLGYVVLFLRTKGLTYKIEQYHVLLIVFAFVVIQYFRTIALQLDEKLSYWYWTRDGIINLIKILLIIIPGIYTHMYFSSEANEVKPNPLLASIVKNDLESFKQLSVKEQQLSNDAFLHLAATRCSYKVIHHLITLGANVNTIDPDGETPLIKAAKHKCLLSTVLLLESGANPDYVDGTKRKAVDYVNKKKSQKLYFYLAK